MYSLTKYNVTYDEIRHAYVAAGLGEITNIKELSDGCFNRIFAATAADGRRYVIKLAPPKSVRVLSHERNILSSEIEYYRLIGQNTDIITPKIIFVDQSESIIKTPYFIMEYLDGERLNTVKLSLAEQEEVTKLTAKILAQFHQIDGENGFGYRQLGLCANWCDAITKMTQALIDDAAAMGKRCKFGKQLLKIIKDNAAELVEIPCVLVNFDLHSMNIFYQRSQDGIKLALLDLERCFWGDPISDFVMPEVLRRLERKRIVDAYNAISAHKFDKNSRNIQIRYYIMVHYLALIANVERHSRFSGMKKFFDLMYISSTISSHLLRRQATSALKKLTQTPK